MDSKPMPVQRTAGGRRLNPFGVGKKRASEAKDDSALLSARVLNGADVERFKRLLREKDAEVRQLREHFDRELQTAIDEKEIAVQVNGKLRGTAVVPAGCEDAVAVEAALADARVKKFTDGCTIVKTIVVKDKLVNIIVKPSK